MTNKITGIHHVTAIAASAQGNVDYYTGILGLRIVKKTVNFDAPEVYHFYYGDEAGNPGSILTFFPYEGLQAGRQGKGMLNTTSFSVPISAMNYWLERLKRFHINFKEPSDRFDEEVVVYLEDHDGLGLELVFNDRDDRPGYGNGNIPTENSIRGIYNIEIWAEGYERTAGLLTAQMGHHLMHEKGNRFRFAVENKPGNYIDIVCAPDSFKGLPGSGTVHHLAFATPDRDSQDALRSRILAINLNPTPILDRKYFSSFYFREPGGVLFEIATSGPGFGVDESLEESGNTLKLPTQFEARRTELESKLVPVVVNQARYQ